MPAMFIERDGGISEDEWRRAVTTCGGRLVGATLDVELRDDDGTFRSVLRWEGTSGEFSMLSYVQPFIAQLVAIARELGAVLVDNDGAIYFRS
ncbi:MAG: hypothetical protein ACKV2T_40530 [Kofleriaceae bacterium]